MQSQNMSIIPGPSSTGDDLDSFFQQVKQIEKRDSVLTSSQQIDRLLRPGSAYFNLNPFDVLQIEPTTAQDDIKKQYKKLSILIHPDKNLDDRERAQQAFDIVKKAHNTIEDPDRYRRVKNILDEAVARLDIDMKEKRKKLKRQGKPEVIEEDTPEVYKRSLYIQTTKLFADQERKRKFLEQREHDETKRAREEELEEVEKQKLEKEFQQNYEESREKRVSSWKDFAAGKSTKKTKKAKGMGFKPPKLKPETR